MHIIPTRQYNNNVTKCFHANDDHDDNGHHHRHPHNGYHNYIGNEMKIAIITKKVVLVITIVMRYLKASFVLTWLVSCAKYANSWS